MKKKFSDQDTVQSVNRAMDILFAFSLEEPELGISELSEKLGMYKSTVFRLIRTLEFRGLVVQNEQNQKYGLGLKLFDLGNIVVSQIELRTVALPLMRHLAEKSGETVTLNIVSNYERVCIEKVESSEGIRNFVQIGSHNHLYMGASGKVIFAHLPEKEIAKILGEISSIEDASSRRFSRSDLMKDLEQIRNQGYACTQGERSQHAQSISAPVRDYTGEVVGSVSTSGPVSRFTPERVKELINLTMRTARDISLQMGWKPQLK